MTNSTMERPRRSWSAPARGGLGPVRFGRQGWLALVRVFGSPAASFTASSSSSPRPLRRRSQSPLHCDLLGTGTSGCSVASSTGTFHFNDSRGTGPLGDGEVFRRLLKDAKRRQERQGPETPEDKTVNLEPRRACVSTESSSRTLRTPRQRRPQSKTSAAKLCELKIFQSPKQPQKVDKPSEQLHPHQAASDTKKCVRQSMSVMPYDYVYADQKSHENVRLINEGLPSFFQKGPKKENPCVGGQHMLEKAQQDAALNEFEAQKKREQQGSRGCTARPSQCYHFFMLCGSGVVQPQKI